MTGMLLDATREAALHTSMRAVRSTWRRRVVLEGAVVALGVILAVVAIVLIVLAVRGVRPGSVEVARVVVWVSIAAATAWWVVRPGLRPVDDARLALYLDEHDPAIAQSVLSAVEESRRPLVERLSPSLSGRLIDTAAGALARLEHGAVIERPRTVVASRRIGALLVGTVVALVLLPSPWRAAARAVLLPWDSAADLQVRRLAVHPGDIELGRGSGLDVAAMVSGFAPTEVTLRLEIEATGESFELPMLADSGGIRFAIRLVDLQDDATYWVEAEGMASGRHRITVVERPAVRELGLELVYPAYTGLASESFDPGGDVAVVVGSEVTVRARVTLPVRGATIRFDDGSTVPMLFGDSTAPVGRFTVKRTGFYTVDLEIEGGGIIAGAVRHLVDALPDRAPAVRITAPGRDTRATSVEEVAIAVSADDDYGVRSLDLVYTVNGGAERRASLLRGAPAGTVEPRAVHTLFLEDLPLVAGDLLSYHAVAADGGGNTAQSDLYFLEVRPFSRNYRQAEAGEGGGGGGGGGGADTPGELTTRQRELVVATFNALRDSATTPPARAREDQTTIAIAQGKLRSDVSGLTTRMVSRGISELDSTFVLIRAALDSAGAAMALAEDALGRGAVRAATPAQQRALQQLQRADAAYREVEVRLGQQPGAGGGGGGGGAAPEDLADLFELQTDRLQNQYEAVQRESAAGAEAAREVDEAEERLRELARRAQAENERSRRLADALQQRLGEQGGAGGAGGGATSGASSGAGAAQRQLAAEAEAEARRLERLARERRTPELDAAARQARAAADQLRRAGAGDPNRGGDAVEALRRAAASVEAGREGAARAAVERLADRARAFEERQRQIAEDALALPPEGSDDRGAALADLDREKLALARDVAALDEEIAAAELAARRERSGAVEPLAGARETIRDGELPARIAYSRGVARNGSAEYVRRFEDQITAYLDRIEGQLREAAAGVGESVERRRERALDQARELGRAAASLRDRLAADTSRWGTGQTGDGQGKDEGEREGQGEGEGRGEGEGQGQARGEGRGPGQGRGRPGDLGQAGGGRDARSGDARQLAGEVRARRETAESLQGELARLGVTLPELGEAIESLRRLEAGRAGTNPRDLVALQADLTESLQRVEFELWRRFGAGPGTRPAVGDAGGAPSGYRDEVEEYFRAIARERR